MFYTVLNQLETIVVIESKKNKLHEHLERMGGDRMQALAPKYQ